MLPPLWLAMCRVEDHFRASRNFTVTVRAEAGSWREMPSYRTAIPASLSNSLKWMRSIPVLD